MVRGGKLWGAARAKKSKEFYEGHSNKKLCRESFHRNKDEVQLGRKFTWDRKDRKVKN